MALLKKSYQALDIQKAWKFSWGGKVFNWVMGHFLSALKG